MPLCLPMTVMLGTMTAAVERTDPTPQATCELPLPTTSRRQVLPLCLFSAFFLEQDSCILLNTASALRKNVLCVPERCRKDCLCLSIETGHEGSPERLKTGTRRPRSRLSRGCVHPLKWRTMFIGRVLTEGSHPKSARLPSSDKPAQMKQANHDHPS